MYEGNNINITINKNIKLQYFVIKQFLLTENINEHQKLEMKIEIDNKNKKEFENSLNIENLEIEIELEKEKRSKKLFSGILNYFEIISYGSDGCEILIKAFSKSILLDKKLEKKYRVFQDKNMTYKNIIDEINKEYKNEKIEVIYNKNAEKIIDRLIIQYEETDWEFLVRLASYLKTGVFVTTQGVITFGIIESSEKKEENKYFSEYSLVRDNMNLYYKVYSNKVIGLGEKVELNKNNRNEENIEENRDSYKNISEITVLKSKIYLEKNILKSEIIGIEMDDYYIFRKYNEKIRGSKIEARVKRVFEENKIAKMEVEFYEGLMKIVNEKEDFNKNYKCYEDYGIKKIGLSYKTFYSQSNTGFFCTPEINDVVEVYFSSNDENSAKVSWAINSEGNGRFSDYEKRNFQINGNGFNFEINKNYIEINVEKYYKRRSKESIEEAENFVNKGEKNMIVVSDNYVGVESLGELSLYGESVELVGKEKGIKIETPDDIRIKGKRVFNN